MRLHWRDGYDVIERSPCNKWISQGKTNSQFDSSQFVLSIWSTFAETTGICIVLAGKAVVVEAEVVDLTDAECTCTHNAAAALIQPSPSLR